MTTPSGIFVEVVANGDPVIVEILQVGPQGPVGRVGIQAIIASDNLFVQNDTVPPGLRINANIVLSEFHAWLKTAPVGSAANVRINRTTSAGVLTTGWYTFSIAAGTKNFDAIGLSLALLDGDLLTFDVTQVGSTNPGSDLAIAMVTQ